MDAPRNDGNGDYTRLLEEQLRLAEEQVVLERAEKLLANERMAELTKTDELTGLMNLGAWTEGIIRELARARRSGELVTVVLLDIDDFGLFKEAFGQLESEELLRDIAISWIDCTRPYDLLARFGRDEFGLVMPGAGTDDALTICGRLREAMPTGHDFAAGIASWDGFDGIDELVDRAEDALEAAKRAGRGQTVAV